MKHKISALIITLLIGITIANCTTTNYVMVMKEPEEKFYKGQYREAANILKPYASKGDAHQLIYMMEAGYMFHAGGDYETSNKILVPAGERVKFEKIDISSEIDSLLTSDTDSEYNGEDFEKALVHMYGGLNFMLMEDYDNARAKFRALNDQLKKMREENPDALYKQNVMAQYLMASAFETVGEETGDEYDLDTAYIGYQQVYKYNPSFDPVKADLQRLSKRLGYMDDYYSWKSKFGNRDNFPQDSGEILVIFQAGLSAIKESRGNLLDDANMNAAINVTLTTESLAAGVTIAAVIATLKMAENPIPKFVKRSNQIKKMRIKVSGQKKDTILLEDIENTAVQNMESQYSSMYKRVAASVALKAAASIAAGLVAKKIAEQSDTLKGASGLIGFAAGMGTGAALFSQMRPDLRCWHTLPANLQMTKLYLPPGDYAANIDYIGYNGRVMDSEEVSFKVEKGKKTYINRRTLY